MTLGELKKKVLMLLDEYSSGGSITVDTDINNKMNMFADMAQKDLSNYATILKSAEIELDGDATPIPAGFKSYFRVWKDGKKWKKPAIINGMMQTQGYTGDIVVEYIATPSTITDETPDSYEFEMNEEAANCLPFYVASKQIITDLVVDYQAFWQMYLQHRAVLDTSHDYGDDSDGFVKQRLWG